MFLCVCQCKTIIIVLLCEWYWCWCCWCRCHCSTTSSGFKIILINFVVPTITYKTIVYSRFALPLSHIHLLAHSLSHFKRRGRIYFIAFILFDLKLCTHTHAHISFTSSYHRFTCVCVCVLCAANTVNIFYGCNFNIISYFKWLN